MPAWTASASSRSRIARGGLRHRLRQLRHQGLRGAGRRLPAEADLARPPDEAVAACAAPQAAAPDLQALVRACRSASAARRPAAGAQGAPDPLLAIEDVYWFEVEYRWCTPTPRRALHDQLHAQGSRGPPRSRVFFRAHKSRLVNLTTSRRSSLVRRPLQAGDAQPGPPRSSSAAPRRASCAAACTGEAGDGSSVRPSRAPRGIGPSRTMVRGPLCPGPGQIVREPRVSPLAEINLTQTAANA